LSIVHQCDTVCPNESTHGRSHVTGFRLYNITYSLLLSISTTSLIFPRWDRKRKLPIMEWITLSES